MYNFSYDNVKDYQFDGNGFPIERKQEREYERRSYNSKRKTLNAACRDFLNKKDTGNLYDVDSEVVDGSGNSHFVEFTQSQGGNWSYKMEVE